MANDTRVRLRYLWAAVVKRNVTLKLAPAARGPSDNAGRVSCYSNELQVASSTIKSSTSRNADAGARERSKDEYIFSTRSHVPAYTGLRRHMPLSKTAAHMPKFDIITRTKQQITSSDRREPFWILRDVEFVHKAFSLPYQCTLIETVWSSSLYANNLR